MKPVIHVRLAATSLCVIGLLARPATAIEVRAVGSLIDRSGNGAHILAQDAAYSIPAGSGSLWVYGDTFFGSKTIQGAVSNSSAWSDDVVASDGITLIAQTDSDGKPVPPLKFHPEEDRKALRLWPGHGVSIAGQTYLFYSVVKNSVHLEQGLAVSSASMSSFTRIQYQGRYGIWGAAEPRMGTAVLGGADGYIYVYGRFESPPYGLILARVRPSAITNFARYEYLCVKSNGAHWARDVKKACAIFDDAPPEVSVSLHAFVGQYLMLYSRFLEEDVVVRLADHPWGPWSDPVSIYKCPRIEDPPQGTSCYAAKEHPQYAKASGRAIYFSMVDGRVFGGSPDLFEVQWASGERRAGTIDSRLHDELLVMSKADQDARQALIAAGIKRPNEKLVAQMMKVDTANAARMRDIVRTYGWPGRSLVGEDGATAAFLLVQHADRDPAFQKRTLPLLHKAYEDGEASGEHLALLTDRVLVAEGKPQLYGSQAEIVGRTISVKRVEDEENLDKRRAELGLPLMADYINQMKKVYGLSDP